MHITPCVYNVAFLCVRVGHTHVSCGLREKIEIRNDNKGKRARGHPSEFADMCQGFIPVHSYALWQKSRPRSVWVAHDTGGPQTSTQKKTQNLLQENTAEEAGSSRDAVANRKRWPAATGPRHCVRRCVGHGSPRQIFFFSPHLFKKKRNQCSKTGWQNRWRIAER